MPLVAGLRAQNIFCSCARTRTARGSCQRLYASSGNPAWTLDEIAGLLIGVLLAATFFFSRKIDELVAKSQRRELGLCELCGGLNEPSQCTEGQCPLKQ